jgi:hypothetical protein
MNNPEGVTLFNELKNIFILLTQHQHKNCSNKKDTVNQSFEKTAHIFYFDV